MNLVIQILRQIAKKWYLWIFIPMITASIIFYLTGRGSKQYVSESALFLNLPTNKGLSLTNEEYKQHEISAYIQDLIQLTHSRKSMEFVKLSILKDYLQGENTLLKTSVSDFPWSDSLAIVERVDSLLLTNQMLDLKQPLDATITIFLRDQGITNESIQSLFQIYREGSSNYLRLKVTTNDPFVSAYLGDKIIGAMMRLNKEVNQGKLEADQKLFAQLVEQAKKELDEKVKNLEMYKIKNNVINLPEHTKAIVNQMVQLEVQKAELIEMLASKQEGILQIKNKLGLKEQIPVDLSKNEKYIEVQNRMREITGVSEGTELRKELTLSQIENTSKELDQLMQQYVSDVPVDIRKAKQELIQQYLNYQVELEMTRQLIPLVEAEVERIAIYARTFAPLESNIGTLEREITTAQETFLILVNKLNLAKTVAQGTGVNELVIIDTPNIPLLPTPSKRKMLIALGSVLCFIIIIFLIATLEYLDSGIWSAKDFKRVFKIEPILVLPDLNHNDSSKDEQLVNYLNVVHVQQVKSLAIKINNIAQSEEREVVLISSLKGEGKQELGYKLARELTYLGYRTKVQIITEFEVYKELAEPVEGIEPLITISILPPTAVFTTWQKWTSSKNIFVWSFHAGRTSLTADEKVLNQLSSINLIPVLTHVLPDYLEDSGTSVLRKRSLFRIWTKRILTLQFKAKNMEVAS